MDHISLLCLPFKKKQHQTNEQHQIETKNMGAATADIHLRKTKEEDVLVIAVNQFAGHG